MQSWAVDSSVVFPLNILIRINLSIKKKKDDNLFEEVEIGLLK